MPWENVWHDREVFMNYNGVTVYHDYDNNDLDDRLVYHFSMSQAAADEVDPACLFDVRDLPTWSGVTIRGCDNEIESAIKLAIERGILKHEEVDLPFEAGKQ